MTGVKLVKEGEGRVNQGGEWTGEIQMKKRNEKKTETKENLIHLTWTIREHIGHCLIWLPADYWPTEAALADGNPALCVVECICLCVCG